MSDITPLNGTKTLPLSEHARKILRDLLRGPIPTQDINPGVVNRLHREELSRTADHPSPYKTHRGRSISHQFITDSGKEAART